MSAAPIVFGVVTGTVVLASVVGVFGSWYTVDQGERCAILRNGAIVGVSDPGWHGKVPLIDDVECVSIRSQVWSATLAAYSRDQQPGDLGVEINWSALPGEVADIYAVYGGLQGLQDRLITPRVPQAVKTVFGQFNAATSISDRARLNLEVQEAVQAQVVGPVIIESVQISDITFSDAYENSVEQRMLAEVEVAKLQQNAEREKVQAQITVTIAEAEAASIRAKAAAQAEATTMRGEAEASAIRAKGAALRDNPGLVSLITAERWDGTLPTTMVPAGAVPFVSVE